jgi:O-antigen/teichoic acid export membrane protein
VIGGTGLIAVAGGVNKLFTLVSAPILTRALGPSPYGVVALLGTVTSLAATVALLGVDMAYARFFFSGSPEDGRAAERFCWRFTMGSACGISLLSGLGWYLWSGGVGLPSALGLMVAAGVFLAVAGTMASTRRRLSGSYFRIAVSVVATGLVGAALAIALALYWRRDAWALLVGAAAGAAAGIAVLRLPPAETIFRGSGLSVDVRRQILRLGLAGAVTAPMHWLMNSADRWFIGLWQGQGPLGVYAFATSVGLAGMMVNSAVTLTWFPEIARDYEAAGEEAAPRIGRLWARLAAGLLVVWLAVSAAGGDVIRLLAAPAFHEGAPYVPWMAGGVLFAGVASLANSGLMLRKDMTPAAAWWTIGAAMNVALNALLVRPLGAYGAAVAACLAYALIAAGAMGSAQSRFRLPVPWGRLAAAGGLALAAGVAMMAPWSAGPIRSLLLKFPVGVAAAAAIAWIVAPDWVLRLFRKEAP